MTKKMNIEALREAMSSLGVKPIFKMFNETSEWDLFQNIIHIKSRILAGHKSEEMLFKEIKEAEWTDNTATRPDFISDNMMIELFEIDDIVTTKKGKNNPQRKADARALRDIQNFIEQIGRENLNPDLKIIASGDTRFNPETDSYEDEETENHHNYQAYIDNFQRVCSKHIDSIPAYRSNFPDKKIGFMIYDNSTYYTSRQVMNPREALLNLPFFDENFMKLFIQSDVDFVIWAFDNKYLYTQDDPHGLKSFLPDVVVISKDNFYNIHSKKIDISSMISLEE